LKRLGLIKSLNGNFVAFGFALGSILVGPAAVMSAAALWRSEKIGDDVDSELHE
jgi:hypothetical protein